MLTILLTLSLCLTDPNSLQSDFGWQLLQKQWLQWTPARQAEVSGPVYEWTYYTEVTPNTRTKVTIRAYRPEQVYKTNYVQVTHQDEERIGYESFKGFARQYRPLVPVVPVEPNEPNLADLLAAVTDPNLVPIIRSLMEKQ